MKTKAVRNIDKGVEYSSIKESSLATGICAHNISRACNGKRCTAGGFRWEFVDKTHQPIRRKVGDKRKKAVRCIETGVEYPSAAEAADATEILASTISRVCNGKILTAGKFHWEFVDKRYRPLQRKVEDRSKRGVRNIDTGVEYPSTAIASVVTGVSISAIHNSCNGICLRTVSRLRWRYVDEDDDNQWLFEGCVAEIRCIDTDTVYSSIAEAADATSVSWEAISRVCHKREEMAGGLRWEFADKWHHKGNKRSVRCVDTDMVYPSIIEAAVAMKVNPVGIYKTCKGYQKTAAGYRWEYVEIVP